MWITYKPLLLSLLLLLFYLFFIGMPIAFRVSPSQS